MSAPLLRALAVCDEPTAWRAAGFSVDERGECRVGGVTIALGAPAPQWTLTGRGAADIDGLATVWIGMDPPVAGGRDVATHANGALRIDHVVVVSPDLERTTAALEENGVRARRTREAGTRRQVFFRLGEVILELVGPPRPDGDGPAWVWGLAITVDDLDAAAAVLGDRLTAPKDAVQPGRRIATVRGSAGATAVALMST